MAGKGGPSPSTMSGRLRDQSFEVDPSGRIRMPTPRGPLLFDAAFEKGASEIFGEAGASEYDAPPPPLKRKRGEAPVLDNASKKARRPSGPPPAPAILPYCDSKISHQSRSLEPLDRDANPNEAQLVAELHVLSKG